jgi:hypothetical protein
MLVAAMAFAWCVISAEKSPPAIPAPQAQAAVMPSAPVEGRRTPIRAAIPADVIAFAKTLVNLPMGSEQIEEIDGQSYVFVLERHYHPPGFVGAPVGWHKGVTAYELH